MGNYKRGTSVYLSLAAGVLAVAAAILYKNVMYTFQPVYYMLIGAAVAAVAQCVIAGFAPRFAAYCPIAIAAVLASAAVWGTQLMVNQLGYVYAGLDGINTIRPWIIFMVCVVVGMVLSIIAAFMRPSLETR